jgi:hypothetical protein
MTKVNDKMKSDIEMSRERGFKIPPSVSSMKPIYL